MLLIGLIGRLWQTLLDLDCARRRLKIINEPPHWSHWKCDYGIAKRKLSAIYQFARAMPLQLIPVACQRNKRKRERT